MRFVQPTRDGLCARAGRSAATARTMRLRAARASQTGAVCRDTRGNHAVSDAFQTRSVRASHGALDRLVALATGRRGCIASHRLARGNPDPELRRASMRKMSEHAVARFIPATRYAKPSFLSIAFVAYLRCQRRAAPCPGSGKTGGEAEGDGQPFRGARKPAGRQAGLLRNTLRCCEKRRRGGGVAASCSRRQRFRSWAGELNPSQPGHAPYSS